MGGRTGEANVRIPGVAAASELRSNFDPLLTLELRLGCHDEAKVGPFRPTDAPLGLLRLDDASRGPRVEWQGRSCRVSDVLSHRRAVLHGDLSGVWTPVLVGKRRLTEMAECSVDWSAVQA